MTSFVFSIEILFGLNFVLFPCEGTISLSGEDELTVLSGENVTIEWAFNNPILETTARSWRFESSGGLQSTIFAILGNNTPVIDKRVISKFEIKETGTLFLRNVDGRYDGMYTFAIGVLGAIPDSSVVKLYVARTIILSGEDEVTVLPGENVTIEWTFNNPILATTARSWRFESSGGLQSTIVTIVGNTTRIVEKTLISRFEIKETGTLFLRNVDDGYDGVYTFAIGVLGPTRDSSVVKLQVAKAPTAVTDCSNPTIVDEGGNVTCLCKGENGNPPANVTWYNKDGVQQGVTGVENKTLSLSNVTGKDNGTYKCVAQSYTLKDDILLKVEVKPTFAPVVTSVSPTKAEIGKSVTITCEASARPEPTYIIKYNGSKVSDEKTYTIPVVDASHAGPYQCIAENKLGIGSKTINLNVTSEGSAPPPTRMPVPTTNSSNKVKSGSVVVVWHVVVSLLSGIIIGVLLSCIVFTVYFRRRFRNRKPAQSNPEPPTSNKVDSIYQDLDLSKMNQEENYQTLSAVNSGNSEYESDYTELKLDRGVEDNYQTLTST